MERNDNLPHVTVAAFTLSVSYHIHAHPTSKKLMMRMKSMSNIVLNVIATFVMRQHRHVIVG